MVVHVNLGQHSYDVVIEKGILRKVDKELNLNRKVLVVTDCGVPKEYAQFVAGKSKEAVIGLIKSGEDYKSLESWQNLLKLMLDNNFTRGDCVIAVGGGIVGDLAGFVAASYMRGIDFYNIPTTVLSQVDSSVGGKTGVNFNGVKNIVGAFHQPKKVLIDAELLKTLPKRQVANGLSEALKMAMTFDKDTVELFKSQDPFENVELLVQKSIEIKARVVEADEKEGGLRRVLNFGHTLGHGIETNCDEQFYHGECVALGMIPMCSEKVRSELIPLLEKLGLPTSCKISLEAACNAIKHDKKAGKDAIHTIYVNEIGSFEQKDMSLQDLRSKLEMVVEK